MNPNVILLSIVLIGFGLLTGQTLLQVGYVGIVEAALADLPSIQIFTDLVIACVLALVWMVRDARQRGAVVWPFVLVTLLAGSFGPLLYLLRRERAGALSASRSRDPSA